MLPIRHSLPPTHSRLFFFNFSPKFSNSGDKKNLSKITLDTAWRKAALLSFWRCFFIVSSIRRFSFSICLRFSSNFSRIFNICELTLQLSSISAVSTVGAGEGAEVTTEKEKLKPYCDTKFEKERKISPQKTAGEIKN